MNSTAAGYIPMLKPLPIEHFNADQKGVKILGRTLATKTTGSRTIDVFVKPDSVWCDCCQSICQHTKFAFEPPAIQEIFRKKLDNQSAKPTESKRKERSI